MKILRIFHGASDTMWNKEIIDSRLRPQLCCHLANCIEMFGRAKAVPLATPAKCLNVIGRDDISQRDRQTDKLITILRSR